MSQDKSTDNDNSLEDKTLSEEALLFAKGSFEALSSLVEDKIEGSLVARFWWTRAQIKLSYLPLTVLMQPLEELLREDNLQINDQELLKETLYELGESLKAKGDLFSSLRVEVLASELRLEGGGNIHQRLKKFLTDVDSSEIGELEKAEKRAEVKFLLERLPKEERTSSSNDIASTTLNTGSLATSHRQASYISENQVNPSKKRVFRAAKTITVVILLIALGFGASKIKLEGLFFNWKENKEESSSFNGQELVNQEIKNPESLLPEQLEPIKLSHFDSLLHKIEESEIKTPGAARDLSNIRLLPLSPPVKVEAEPLPTITRLSPEIKQLPKAEETYYPKLEAKPTLDRRSPLFDRPDGGMRRDWGGYGSDGEKRTQKRDDTFSLEEFKGGKVYRILSSCDVFDRPSASAKRVFELRIGDRTKVYSRLGDWLEIRSQKGNIGYIKGEYAEESLD
jgi:hypothetical protein